MCSFVYGFIYEFNNEYAKYFDSEFPARATVGVELKADALLRFQLLLTKSKLHHVLFGKL